ncbi:Glycosyltransferase involved in cell wall bisynthesis [Desulfoscipio geothermicus DSM 3669]|uniref:Glycosyltransferase involved in cell wall bisynthesis n=2 Tax=Desulfoscipio geothermicus TaxID=39060 RepID=A0A1I6E2V6_9FIRM|nr:Glycosyltransferase involved in cell wall bisynthesis [Desulfoscipio geothermicus DSM 3669]
MLQVAMFVINNFTNDARVHREAATLADSGYRVTVIALKDGNTPAEETVDNFYVRRINLLTRSLPRVPGFQIFKYLEFIICSVFLAVRIRADICHGHDLNALVPAFVAARVLKAYLIYDTHELATGQNTQRRRIWGEMSLWHYMERWLIKRVHLVLTVSPGIADELAGMYGIDRPQVIMNCPPYENVTRNNLLREFFNFNKKDVIVIYHGVFGPNRGIEVLVESFVHIPKGYKLVLMGPDNSFKGFIKNTVRNLNLLDRVFFHPAVPVKDVVKYVASADVGTFLSNPQIKSQQLGLPNKLFECMAAGTPIVVGTICRELVLQLGVGVACDQNSPVSLAEAIQRLTTDSNLYHRVQQSAREYARSEYNWQAQGRKLRALYEMLQHESRRPGIS